MHNYIILFNLFFLTLESSVSALALPKTTIAPKVMKRLIKNELYSKVVMKEAKGNKKDQTLDYYIIGLHKKPCSVAMAKLAQYERYQEFLSIVEKSLYNSKDQKIYLALNHYLMPFKMSLHFKLERLSGPGDYNFSFDRGFLKGLTGIISISKYQKRCLFETKAHWQGPHTGISTTVFTFFSETVGLIAMKRLFKISETY